MINAPPVACVTLPVRRPWPMRWDRPPWHRAAPAGRRGRARVTHPGRDHRAARSDMRPGWADGWSGMGPAENPRGEARGRVLGLPGMGPANPGAREAWEELEPPPDASLCLRLEGVGRGMCRRPDPGPPGRHPSGRLGTSGRRGHGARRRDSFRLSPLPSWKSSEGIGLNDEPITPMMGIRRSKKQRSLP